MSIVQTIKDVVLVPTHPKGKPIILMVFVVTLVLYLFSDTLGFLGLLGTLFSVYFFRNPDRQVPQGEGMILATGDGVVCDVTSAKLPPEIAGDDEADYTRVSIFLNVFNVHVNRFPVSGVVTREVYVPGKFLNAALDKASTDNERSLMTITTDAGETIAFSQIAGFVARRIVCDANEGDKAEQGARYGIIRFGSRCDIYVPAGYDILVSKGSVAVGGETIIASNPKTFKPSALDWKTD